MSEQDFICEQCGRDNAGKQEHSIDDIIICHPCFCQLRGHARSLRGPIYDIVGFRKYRGNKFSLVSEERKLYQQDYYQKNKATMIGYGIKKRALWPNKELTSPRDPIVVASERFAVEEILPKLGFKDILWTRDYNPFFIVDILAKDPEGKECGFDVKLGIMYDIDHKKETVIRHLGMRYFIVHVKADLSFYHMNEIIGNKFHSTAYWPYVQFMKSKGIDVLGPDYNKRQ